MPNGFWRYSHVSRAGFNDGAADTTNVQARKIEIREKRCFIGAIVKVVFKISLNGYQTKLLAGKAEASQRFFDKRNSPTGNTITQ
jgi:hypothetical protein